MAQTVLSEGYSPLLRPPEQPWAAELWSQGLRPVLLPYVIDGAHGPMVSFPLPFIGISAVALAVGGWRVLFGISLLSMAVAWTVIARYAVRRLDDRRSILSIVSLTVAGSFAVPYGAMYWEHAPALACVVGGMALHPLLQRRQAWAHACGGMLVGAATLLRPEVALMSAITTALALGHRESSLRARVAWTVGAVVGVAAWVIHNLAVFGSSTGAHALQVFDATQPTAISLPGLAERLASMGGNLALHGVEAWALVAILGLAATQREGRDNVRCRAAMVMLAAFGLFCVAVACIVPNDGGKQWGPRYFVVGLPLVWTGLVIAVASLRERARQAAHVVLSASAIAGVLLNLGGGLVTTEQASCDRIYPLYVQLSEMTPDAIAVAHQDIGLDLGLMWESVPFFRGASTEDAARIADALRENGGSSLAWVFSSRRAPDVSQFAVAGTHAQLLCTRLPDATTDYAVFSCAVVPS
jgi:hypothetical protein